MELTVANMCSICRRGETCPGESNYGCFKKASKEQLIDRVDSGNFKDSRELMVDTLKCNFGIKYRAKKLS